MKKVIVIHGWEGTPNSDWFQWLKKELKKHNIQVEIPEMPETEAPKIESWVSLIKEKIKTADKDIILIGHSIGCQTILRAIEQSPETTQIEKIILVAGWFTLQGMETEEEEAIAQPWLETPINLDKVKKRVKKIVAIFSDNDPFVSLENVKVFKEKLGAEIIIQPGQEHFNNKTALIVLKKVLETGK